MILSYLKQFDAIWSYLKWYRVICSYCSYLDRYETIWSDLERFGAIWSYLEQYNFFWRDMELLSRRNNLKLFKAIWSYMKLYGASCEGYMWSFLCFLKALGCMSRGSVFTHIMKLFYNTHEDVFFFMCLFVFRNRDVTLNY